MNKHIELVGEVIMPDISYLIDINQEDCNDDIDIDMKIFYDAILKLKPYLEANRGEYIPDEDIKFYDSKFERYHINVFLNEWAEVEDELKWYIYYNLKCKINCFFTDFSNGSINST
jgi:hypothetical protein